MLDLNSVYKFVVKIAKKAYKNARKIKQNLIENKELNDIVTSVDKVMEREIVDNLAKLFPTHSFMEKSTDKVIMLVSMIG